MSIRPFVPGDFSDIEHIYSLSKLDELRYEKGVFDLLPLTRDEPRREALMASRIFVYDEGRIKGYSLYVTMRFAHSLCTRNIGETALENGYCNTRFCWPGETRLSMLPEVISLRSGCIRIMGLRLRGSLKRIIMAGLLWPVKWFVIQRRTRLIDIKEASAMKGRGSRLLRAGRSQRDGFLDSYYPESVILLH